MKKKAVETKGQQYREIPIKSAIPFWGAAVVWVIAAAVMPMHKISIIILTAFVSVGIYAFITLILPKKTIREKIPYFSGDKPFDEIINSIDESMEVISADSKQVYAERPEGSGAMNEILSYILKIREDILKNPQKVKKISRFLNYYLPTTVKLSNKYVYLLQQRSQGENVTEALSSIEKAFEQIKQAFIKQHDALFEEEALDLSTDVDVLETLIKQDDLD